MSTERTKFVAGKRGVIDVNAFYGSMTVGGGEGGGIPLVVRSRVAPLWQRQQLDVKTRSTLVNRRRDQVAATSSARRVPTTTVGARKLATRRVATTDVPPKKATATTTINIRRNNDNGDYKWHATGRTLTMNGSNGKRVATKRVARTGRNMEPIVTKWLLMPQSNFRQSSVSSLEDITREAAAEKQTDDQQQQQEMQQQQLNLEAKPKSILVNSKVSKLLLDEQTQAQLKPLLTKRQQQSLLLQADNVESATFVDNSKLAASSAKPSPNSSSNTNSNWHSKSSSNSTYQTALGICCSSSGSWEHEQPILPQTAGNRGLKITATVIKIMPELPATKATTNLPVSGGATAATAAKAVPTAVTTLPVVTPPTVAASKPQKRILYKAKQTQQTERLPVKPIKLKQPPAIATAATRAKATAAGAAPATVAAKIVRVVQHKVPSTIEDGIDVSYQYFVSTPLARGKKPLPIRYLYRPMMRRLNKTTAATRHGRRSKKGTSKTETEPTEADQPPVLSQSSTDVESDSGSEQQQVQEQQQQQQQQAQPQEFKKKLLVEDEQDFKPPPLLVDPKYLPFVKQLKNHPMPKETRAQQQYNIQLQRQHQQQKRQQLEQQHWQQQNLRHQHLEQQQLQQQYLQQQQLQQEQLRAQQLEQERLEQQQFSILQQMKLQLHKQQRVIQEQQQQLLAQQQQQQEQNKRPTLLDYQPNVTRLPAVGGANICFHAPIRMCAGNEAATATTTTATNTETTATTPAFGTAAAIPSIAAVETATTAQATASIAAATAAGTTAMQSLIAAVRYEDIEIPSCSEKCVSFEMENKCCCSASNISNMSPKSRSDKKKRKSKARGKKKNRK